MAQPWISAYLVPLHMVPQNYNALNSVLFVGVRILRMYLKILYSIIDSLQNLNWSY